MEVFMKEWFVYFSHPGDDPATESVVLFSSPWKLILWFFLNAHKCRYIFVSLHINGVLAR